MLKYPVRVKAGEPQALGGAVAFVGDYMNSIVALTLIMIALPVAAQSQEFLAPVFSVDTAGAFGSRWRSELTIANPSDSEISVFPFDGSCPVTCPFSFVVEPRKTIINPPVERALAGEPPGRVIKVGDSSNQVSFQLRIFDTTRTSIRFGAEIPVVPSADFTNGAIQLLNLPVAGGYRYMLRIYSLDRAMPGAALVRAYEIASAESAPDRLIAELVLPLSPGQRQQDPSYAEYSSLANLIATGTASALRFEVSQTVPTAGALWAFISVTNDDSQEFFVITPAKR